jgi:hypothetical protein
MMINATFRGPGGLADHVQRIDTNESVVLRDDLSVECSLSIDDAIADFAAIGAAMGANAPLIHITVSPAKSLGLEQERRMLALIAQVYGVPEGHPRLVVMHVKPGATGRPAHYHVVMPRAKSDGRVIKDSYYKKKNERIARELEFDFGHELIPGPHIDSVRARLRIERPDMMEAIEHLKPPARENDQTSVADKNFAQQYGVDLPEFDARVLAAWQAGAFGQEPATLAPFKLKVARGDKAVMVVDTVTGLGQSLQRVLNRESKRQGAPLKLKQHDVKALLSADDDLEALAAVRHDVIRSSVQQIHRQRREAATIEKIVGSSPPPAQPEPRPESKPTSNALHDANADAVAALTTQRAQIEAIKRWRQETIDSRKRAADKAWRTARLWRSRKLEDFVLLAGAGAAFACGAGLIVSIGAGLFVSAYVVAKGKERFQAARSASAALKQSRIETKREVDAYFSSVRQAQKFDLKEIPREAKAAVGHIFTQSSRGREPRPDVIATLDRVQPDLAAKVILVARYSTSAKLRTILHGMCPPNERHAARALDAFVGGRSKRELDRMVLAAQQRAREGRSR